MARYPRFRLLVKDQYARGIRTTPLVERSRKLPFDCLAHLLSYQFQFDHHLFRDSHSLIGGLPAAQGAFSGWVCTIGDDAVEVKRHIGLHFCACKRSGLRDGQASEFLGLFCPKVSRTSPDTANLLSLLDRSHRDIAFHNKASVRV